MKSMLCFGVAVLLAVGLATAGDQKSDSAKLQGSWSNEVDGKKHDLKFAKDSFTFTMVGDDKKMVFKGTWKIDAAKKPKQIDMKVTEGEKYKGDTALAIYQLDGDVLKWCANEPGKDERPAAFPEQQGKGEFLYLIFKRAK